MTTTEERIAAALRARADEVTMGPLQIDREYARLREAAQARRTRRPLVLTGLAAAAVAAVIAAVAVTGDSWDLTAPAPAQTPTVETVEETEAGQYLRSEQNIGVGATYRVEDAVPPFAFTPPDLAGLGRNWHFGAGVESSAVNIDFSDAEVVSEVLVLPMTYVPGTPWTQQTSLVPSPGDAQGWFAWMEASGLQPSEPREVVVGDVPGQSVQVSAPADLPEQEYYGCWPGARCIAFAPQPDSGPGERGQHGIGAGHTGTVTVVEVDGMQVLIVQTSTTEAWAEAEPVLTALRDSIRWL